MTNLPEIMDSADNPVVRTMITTMEDDFGNLNIGKNERNQYYFFWDKLATNKSIVTTPSPSADAVLGSALAAAGKNTAKLVRETRASITNSITILQGEIVDNKRTYNSVDTWMAQERPRGRLDILERVVPWLKTLAKSLQD